MFFTFKIFGFYSKLFYFFYSKTQSQLKLKQDNNSNIIADVKLIYSDIEIITVHSNLVWKIAIFAFTKLGIIYTFLK